MTAAHHSALAAHIYPGNPAFEHRMQMLTGGMVARGFDMASAHQMALKIIGLTVQQQAATMSFNDSFLLIGLSIVLVSPAILLLRSGKKGEPAASAAAEAH
jgi:DHA2 family multidrug resistance protein